MAVKMGHIFISYSHKDKVYAHTLAEALEARGFDAWIDHDIDYGASWPTTIRDKLDACDAFIVIVSENSSTSEWVQNEVTRAKRKRKPIFPLLLSGESWLSLETTQYVDVKNRSLPPEQFYECLRLVTSKPEPPAPGSDTDGEPIIHPDPQPPKPPSEGYVIKFGPIAKVVVVAKVVVKVGVYLALLVGFVLLSRGFLPLIHPATPTPLQPDATLTAISTQALTPSITPPGTSTPTITPTSTAMPVVVVNTSSLSGWVPDFNQSKGDKTKNRIELSENAIKLSYVLGVDGFAILTKKLNSKTLAGTDGISFSYMGEGFSNTLEFKVLLRYPDHGGDTTYGIVWNRATNTDGKWLEMKVPYSDLWCWGPPSDCAEHPDVDIKMVDRLDFAVSNKTGNPPSPGWILIKDVFGIVP